jgi:hypothetical protein
MRFALEAGTELTRLEAPLGQILGLGALVGAFGPAPCFLAQVP